jgi:hypothetical protein
MRTDEGRITVMLHVIVEVWFGLEKFAANLAGDVVDFCVN